MQLQTSDTPKHAGIMHETSRQLMALIHGMQQVDWAGQHCCRDQSAATDCSYCTECRSWHALCAKLCHFLAPRERPSPPVRDLPQLESICSKQQAHLVSQRQACAAGAAARGGSLRSQQAAAVAAAARGRMVCATMAVARARPNSGTQHLAGYGCGVSGESPGACEILASIAPGHLLGAAARR